MHNHQSKVKAEDRREFCNRILKQWKREHGRDFDALYDFLDEIKPYGIGPVTTYDVATRIGAYLNVEPTSLYLKAGTLDGWHALGLDVPRDAHLKCGSTVRLPSSWWPESLRTLPADQVEDLLCAYRGLFVDLENID
jgi:hypothetical protein